MIRAVFFDFYGTLAGWQPNPELIQRSAAAAEGLVVDPAAIVRAYPTANALLDGANAIRPLRDRPREERDAFFAEYERTLLVTAGYDVGLATAAAIWARVSATPKEFGLFADTLPTLKALHQDGMTLGVISNMGNDLPDYVKQLGLDPYVSVTVSSAEVGMAKPHPAVFERALSKAGVTASEAVHVGDGYDSDVVGSSSAGLHAIWVSNEHSGEAPPAMAVVPTLSGVLPEIAKLR